MRTSKRLTIIRITKYDHGLRSGGQKMGLELMQWNAASACDSEDVNISSDKGICFGN